MSYFDTDDADTKDLNPAMKLLDESWAGRSSQTLSKGGFETRPYARKDAKDDAKGKLEERRLGDE